MKKNLTNILTAENFKKQKWIDERLIWNENQFNLTELTLPYDKIWIPDIVLEVSS